MDKSTFKQDTKILIWQYYKHPFDADQNDIEFPGHDGYKPPKEEDDDDDDDDFMQVIDMDDMVENALERRTMSKKMIMTPLGMIPMADYNDLSKVFRLWLAHTNFWLTETIEELINTTKGVEELTIMTPYRFRIAIGKAFNTIDVKMR